MLHSKPELNVSIVSWIRTHTTGLYNTWKSAAENKSMKLFMGEKWLVTLPDGDQLCLLVNEPSVQSKREIILVVHGLAGAATDPSVSNVAEKFLSEGHVVVRMNLRGSGHGAGLAKRIYHAGRDEDFLVVVDELRKRFPTHVPSIVAMSLSSNMMFRYLAKHPVNPIERAIALSPVVDLKLASQRLSNAYLGMINKSVINILKSYFTKQNRAFSEIQPPDWTKIKRFYQFDSQYVAPMFGFKDVNDYYSTASAIPFISDVKTPWKAVITLDDPIAISEKKLFKKNFPSNTVVLPSGGHLYLKKHGGLGEVAFRVFSGF